MSVLTCLDNVQNDNDNEEYASDKLDESEGEEPALKKRKLSKAAEAKAKAAAKEKAKAKAKGKGKGKRGDDNDDYEEGSDEEEDAYTALSKMWKDSAKPPIGSFEECAKCSKQFTVVSSSMHIEPS